MQILEKSLLDAATSLPNNVKTLLQGCIETDVAQLRPLLEERAEDAKNIALKRLTERAEIEAKAIESILSEQKKRVESSLKKSNNDDQMSFGFNDEEKRQLESDRRYWKKWLETVDQDLIEEPARIRSFYEIDVSRVEPIGLVYLWPSS